MKKLFLYLLVFLALAVISVLSTPFQDEFVVRAPGAISVNMPVSVQAPVSVIPANVFPDNEKIKFGVYSNGLKVGSGELFYGGLKIEEGDRLQRVLFQVSTLSVKDREDIRGTIDFSAPVRVSRSVRLFGRDESIQEVFSPDYRHVQIRKSVDGKDAPDVNISSDKEFGHVLLFLYRLRNDKDLAPGKVYDVNLPTQRFKMKVVDTRVLRSPLGRHQTFYLESSPPKYKIWLKTTPDRLPVRIQGLIGAGLMYLAATEVTTDPS